MRTLAWIVGGFAILLVASLPFACWRLAEDTEYAPGFTHSAFEAIELGQDRAQVLSALGAPLSTHAVVAGEQWLDCDPSHAGFREDGSLGGSFTLVEFGPDGRVSNTLGQVETAGQSTLLGQQGTITIGPGFLGISPELQRALVGETQAAIRARFGLPRHVRVKRAVEHLHYSRSPSSSDYQVRRIGVDDRGVVVEKSSYRYQD